MFYVLKFFDVFCSNSVGLFYHNLTDYHGNSFCCCFCQQPVNFNIYSPNNSSTSKEVQCSSSLCSHADQCSSPSETCPYQVSYLSDNTSSTGYLVEDILHLTTNDDQSKPVNAKITLG